MIHAKQIGVFILLDRNKPYQTVHGDNRVRYIQGDVHYDGSGIAMVLPPVEAPTQEIAPEVVAVEPEVVVVAPEIAASAEPEVTPPAAEVLRNRLRIRRK